MRSAAAGRVRRHPSPTHALGRVGALHRRSRCAEPLRPRRSLRRRVPERSGRRRIRAGRRRRHLRRREVRGTWRSHARTDRFLVLLRERNAACVARACVRRVQRPTHRALPRTGSLVAQHCVRHRALRRRLLARHDRRAIGGDLRGLGGDTLRDIVRVGAVHPYGRVVEDLLGCLLGTWNVRCLARRPLRCLARLRDEVFRRLCDLRFVAPVVRVVAIVLEAHEAVGPPARARSPARARAPPSTRSAAPAASRGTAARRDRARPEAPAPCPSSASGRR